MVRKMRFTADPESFQLLRDDVGIGKVCELSFEDASLLAPHIESHPETIFVAASGVDLADYSGTMLLPERTVAIEWIRQENNPQRTELEANMYRYLFGMISDGTCCGYEIWDRESTPQNLQVGDHWMTLDNICSRYLS